MRYRVGVLSVAVVMLFSILSPVLFAQDAGQIRGRGPGNGQDEPQVRRPQAPALPTPHGPDGRVILGPLPGQTGLWNSVDARISVPDVGVGRGPGGPPDAPRYPNLKYSEVPFQPWAKALFHYRLDNAFEPHTRCKPSSGPREIMSAYGIEFADIPDLKRIYILDQAGPHNWRTIYMDGREHPKNLVPSYEGHSTGRWDGDTLVVDTIGYMEGFWMDREGSPHTEQLHLVERFTRTDMNTLRYVVTVDDPGAYTAPWTGGFYLRWAPSTELFEYVCQENNFAPELMIGAEESVNRTSRIVP